MSISDPYTALKYLLQTNTAISSMLGKYQGTTIPLIAGGSLAETETALPCIVYYNNNQTKNFNVRDTIFTVNCYAETERESFLLASKIVDEYQSWQGLANGYNVMTTARILAVIPNPTDKEVNTAVEMRLTNIGGA